jgi:hypothetical protein
VFVMNNQDVRTVDWHLLWTAGGVIITLGSIIFGCFVSLSRDIGNVAERLTVIETTLILKGIMPKELALETSKSFD